MPSKHGHHPGQSQAPLFSDGLPFFPLPRYSGGGTGWGFLPVADNFAIALTDGARTLLLILTALAAFLPAGGCKRTESAVSGEVVLYTSIDEPIARPILHEFEHRTGVHV